MPAFFDIDLKEVAKIVEGRAGMPEQMLLLDGSGLGVALRDDDAAELRAEFPRHLLPYRLAVRVTESDGPVGDLIRVKIPQR